MIKIFFTYLVILSFALILSACSASTGSRYNTTNGDKKESLDENSTSDISAEKKNKSLNVDTYFDMTHYRSKIKFDSSATPKINRLVPEEDIWYSYNEKENSESDSLITKKMNGYRVQVLVTDNLEEANQIRTEIYFTTNQKHVYVSFEPPFYKVKVGDYTTISDANNLQFKLKQMGYSESKVVNEEVTILQ